MLAATTLGSGGPEPNLDLDRSQIDCPDEPLIPRTHIRFLTALVLATLALAAQALGPVLLPYIFPNPLLVICTGNIDLLHRRYGQPTLDPAPDRAEHIRRIDDLNPPTELGKVVVQYPQQLLQLALHGPERTQPQAGQIDNHHVVVDPPPAGDGARFVAVSDRKFQSHGKILDDPLRSGLAEHGGAIHVAEVLNKDRTAEAIGLVEVHAPTMGGDFVAFGKVKFADKAVEVNLLLPSFSFEIHGASGSDIEVARSEEAPVTLARRKSEGCEVCVRLESSTKTQQVDEDQTYNN